MSFSVESSSSSIFGRSLLGSGLSGGKVAGDGAEPELPVAIDFALPDASLSTAKETLAAIFAAAWFFRVMFVLAMGSMGLD